MPVLTLFYLNLMTDYLHSEGGHRLPQLNQSFMSEAASQAPVAQKQEMKNRLAAMNQAQSWIDMRKPPRFLNTSSGNIAWNLKHKKLRLSSKAFMINGVFTGPTGSIRGGGFETSFKCGTSCQVGEK